MLLGRMGVVRVNVSRQPNNLFDFVVSTVLPDQ
jgi:hypothetical protein